MSTLKVNALNNGGSAIDFPNSLTLSGNPIEQGYTSSATEPTSPSTGDLWWDSANKTLHQYLNGEFKELTLSPPLTNYGDRGLVAGGYNGSVRLDNIQYFAHATAGNASDFGDLIGGRSGISGCSNATRGLFAGGYNGVAERNQIDYVTIATTGDATDFGNLTRGEQHTAGVSDGTYGVFASSMDGVIESVTIATVGNATDFGDLTNYSLGIGGAADKTRGLFASGYDIQYITIATAGNATDSGIGYASGTSYTAMLADDTRAVIGHNVTTNMQYYTIQNLSTASDFGQLAYARNQMAASSDGTYGNFAGGYASTTRNFMDKITVQTTGAATDFGDLQAATRLCAGTSGASA